MPTFTLPNGSPLVVVASDIARVRPSLRNEIYGHPGVIGSALFKPKQLVLEKVDVVGPALWNELNTFAQLHAPNGVHIWFDSVPASDAMVPSAREARPGVNSVVIMAGVRQRLSDTVAAAQAVIDQARAGNWSPDGV